MFLLTPLPPVILFQIMTFLYYTFNINKLLLDYVDANSQVRVDCMGDRFSIEFLDFQEYPTFKASLTSAKNGKRKQDDSHSPPTA